jgi:hypothetical protein
MFLGERVSAWMRVYCACVESTELSHNSLNRLRPYREPHSSSNLPPPFWDNMSKIWLTRQALNELGRRNAQSTSNRSPVQQPALPVSEYLSKVSQADIARLKVYARRGGPDLTDLRGVCTI